MNKFMALLLLLGAIGCFGLSQRGSFPSQSQSRTGAPTGEVRTHRITRAERGGYIAFGVVCMVGCLYFIAQTRRDDER